MEIFFPGVRWTILKTGTKSDSLTSAILLLANTKEVLFTEMFFMRN